MLFEHELFPVEAGTEVVHHVTFSGLQSSTWPAFISQINKELPITLSKLKATADKTRVIYKAPSTASIESVFTTINTGFFIAHSNIVHH